MRRILLMALLTHAAHAQDWIRLSSPSAEIFTDTSEKTARAILHRFDTLRRIFEDSKIAAPSTPVRVFLFASARDFEDYQTDRTVPAFYQSAGGQDLIVARQDTALERIATHEYLHMVAQHTSASLPGWLNEGIAEFYSTISIGKTKIRVGEPIPEHLSTLASKPWINLLDLHSNKEMFYAESWALVHMLSLAPAWHHALPEFVKLLNDGRDPQNAFQDAFGKSMDQAMSALHSYVHSPKVTTIPMPPAADSDPSQLIRLSKVDATLALAELAVSTDHTDRARVLFHKAAQEHPESAAAIAGLAELALVDDRNEDARRGFEQAIAMGYRAPGAYFELAMLTKDDAFLEQALALDPHFAEAHFLLGVHATDRGNFTVALDHLRQAVGLQPRRFTYWHALGYAQAKSGDRQGAAESARTAAAISQNDQEDHMAAALTQLAAELPPVRTPHPDVITPPSWQNPKGDAHAEGTLTRVNCDSNPVSLQVSTTTSIIELNVANPNQIELINASGPTAALSCGEQSHPVAIEYIAQSRTITRISFK